MGGGLMQLVAYGAQDIYLTGNPQITFFKVVYRRHTNFSMETIQQTINGTSTLTTSATSGTVTISRNGDLVSGVWVRCDQDATTGVAGDKLITDVEVEIGGQRIDKHYKEWNQVWAELTTPASKQRGYQYMTGGLNNAFAATAAATAATAVIAGRGTVGTGQQSIQVPLNFWFCRNPGLALPLIALQYHEVKLKFNWGLTTNAMTGVSRNDSTTVGDFAVEVWCDYIYLDTDERRRFAQVSHEYLIEQLQTQTESSATPASVNLNFNHPVKELIWTAHEYRLTTQRTKLQLNGHDRFAEQDKEYFTLRQPYQYHTSVPGHNIKELDNPVMLSKPTEVVAVAAAAVVAPGGSAGNGIFEVDASGGSGGSNAVIFQSATDPNLRVGDILSLSYEEGGAGDSFTHIVSIKDITTAWPSAAGDTVFHTNETLAADSVAGGGGISKLGSIQAPQSNCSQLMRDIYCYSFALKPEEHQPSGTCNFSRIDNAKLMWSAALRDVTDADTTGGSVTDEDDVTIYAVNYNVLRIMSGMGGLAYSN